MANNYPRSLRSPRNGNHHTTTPSPLRHASNVSASSSEESAYSNPFPPSRTSTVSSTASVDRINTNIGHKRGIGETSPTKTSAVPDYHYIKDQGSPPRQPNYGRESLRPLSQAPNVKMPPPSNTSLPGSREQSPERATTENSTPVSPSSGGLPQKPYSIGIARSDSRRAPVHNQSSRPVVENGAQPTQSHLLESSDLEKLGKSTTGHLRALSKFAEEGEDTEFSITKPEQEVVGLHGRRRLQRNMSARGRRNMAAPGYGGRTWMDAQRQYLQAYEYLCHIGEAKEWIEDIIHRQIPPIVQLEEALRDGVTLAEVVQELSPRKNLKIFRNPKLQFRHSDNIAHFFRYLNEVELPELFRFELVDLYEKKNIPKVIYCIHALSWVLLRKGIVDFRIGNLVGQLEFEHHELEATQKGLDKAGVSMPNFSGMRENLGAEPEPEPEPLETEDERIERELVENETYVVELQAQLRGALLRMGLGDTMQMLWDDETLLIDLQSRIRGDWARQISDYRIEMKRFATDLQSITRGFLIRSREKRKQSHWKDHEKEVIVLQSLLRARKAKQEARSFRSQVQRHENGIKHIQAAIRGALLRRDVIDHQEETREAQDEIVAFQTRLRGAIERMRVRDQKISVEQAEPNVRQLQASIRGMLQRKAVNRDVACTRKAEHIILRLQSHARALASRQAFQDSRRSLKEQNLNITQLQSNIRALRQRKAFTSTLDTLESNLPIFTQLQAASRGHALRQRHQVLKQRLSAQVNAVLGIQASVRGFLERQRIFDLLASFEPREMSIIRLQSLLRATMLRGEVSDDLENLDAEEEPVVELQAAIRGMLIRKQFAEKQRHYRENMKKVIKIQSYIRGRQQGEAYKSLTTGKNPPVGTVKNFVHLLNDSDFDFDEEVESEKLRKAVGQRVRENEQTEQWIAELDAKIGLLAQNKIARDEYVKIQRHYGSQASNLLASRNSVSRDTFNLKSLNKNSRAKLDLYQELFFTLQTKSQYFARLLKSIREQGASEEEYKRLEMLLISTFGFAQRRREEYYLLRLISRAIKEEVDGCASLQEYYRGSFIFSRLFYNYTRRPQDRKYLRESLGPLIRTEILENPQLDLESDPLQIYRAIISDEELRTGQRSQKNLDMPREEAIRDPETRQAFVQHLQDLRDLVDHFFITIEESLHRMPFGARFVAQQMFEILRNRFPRESEQEIFHIVASWLWKTYLKPAVTEPENCGVIDRGVEGRQKRNLCEFAKVLNQIIVGRPFGNENVYLQPLNSYVEEAIGRLEEVFMQLIDVGAPEPQFDMDEFNDLYVKVKPTLHIKMADVFAVHQMIISNLAQLCVAHEDNGLRDVIRELGSAKTNEAEMSAGSADVTLSLSSKQHKDEDPDSDVKALFMETKRCVLYIIRIQSGAHLLEVMVKPVSEDDEDRWSMLVSEELAVGSRKRGAYSDANNLIDIASMSYAELKRTALENILDLERRNRLTRGNHYQDLLNDIALDIRQKHRRRVQRQRELENTRSTLMHLEEKANYLEDKLKAYNDTFEQNLNVLQNKKGKKRFLMPFSKQYNHEKELERLGRKPTYGSYIYSAETLAEKGILVEWKGRNLRENDIIISSDEVNVFNIEGSTGNIGIPGAQATFTWDDLLEAQYQGQTVLRFFGAGEGMGGGIGGSPLVLDAKLFMQQVSKKFWPEG